MIVFMAQMFFVLLFLLSSIATVFAESDIVEKTAPKEETALSEISGTVWADTNEDGKINSKETGIKGIKVFLFSKNEKKEYLDKAVTNSNGKYSFKKICPGEYYLVVEGQTVNDKKYFVPVKKIQAGTDNKYDIDTSSSATAYTGIIKIEDNSEVTDINAGMRLEIKTKTKAKAKTKTQIKPLAITGGGYVVTTDTTPSVIGAYDTLAEAVSNCITTDSCTITITENDLDLGSNAVTIPSAKKITITSDSNALGSPFKIMQINNKRHIILEGSLTLKNITLEGVGNTYDGVENGGIEVKPDAKLTIAKDAIIQKCYWANGGAVFVSGGTVNLDGGSITNNVANSDGGAIRGTDYYGAGAKINIKSGDISKNKAGYGAGISVNYGSIIIMDGGNIIDNVTKNRGGGVNIDSNASFTMNGGKISGNTAGDGGGIISGGGSTIVINDGEISGNTTTGYGGGIKSESNCPLTLNQGTITNNKATGNGGGVFADENNNTVIKTVNITYNETNGDGGGVFIQKGVVSLNGAVIKNNKAMSGDGGGIRVTGSVHDNKLSTLNITTADISNNNASHGGGISANNKTTITMDTGTITNNTATSRGGGVNIDQSTSFTMQDGKISKNKATDGAGVIASVNSPFTMNDGEISDNEATGEGAGIRMEGSTLEIYNGEITGNKSSVNGGGIEAQSSSIVIIHNAKINSNAANNDGGGLRLTDSKLTMDDGEIKTNTAKNDGGGIRLRDSEATINGGIINQNTAKVDGGALRISSSKLTISNVQINSNKAEYGGGVSAQKNSTVIMNSGSTINSNIITGRGGGVNIDDNTTFTMNDGQINSNQAESGGGVLATLNSTFTIIDGEIKNNNVTAFGGGLQIQQAALNISGGTISLNGASSGGGIYLLPSSPLVMTGGLVTHNTTTGDGGGIFTEDYSYTDPLDAGSYTNITIASPTMVVDNTAGTTQLPPSSLIGTLNFDKSLLTNDEINYYPQMGQINGYVFQDDNTNNLYDAGEGLNGRTVTLYRKQPDGTYLKTDITAVTDSNGMYKMEVELNQSYKVSFKVLDDDGVGRMGFITKGNTNVSSHVNHDGFSDEIIVGNTSDTQRTYTVNAGYALPNPAVTGFDIDSKPWIVLLAVSAIGLVGFILRKKKLM